jgi:hypothetical protein
MYGFLLFFIGRLMRAAARQEKHQNTFQAQKLCVLSYTHEGFVEIYIFHCS